jgi:hypothetical protein
MDYYEGNGTNYEAHPPSGCSTTNPNQAPDPGEGIKQVNKQPPNRPNFNIIIIGKKFHSTPHHPLPMRGWV